MDKYQLERIDTPGVIVTDEKGRQRVDRFETPPPPATSKGVHWVLCPPPPPPPEPTPEQRRNALDAALTRHYQATAWARGWDNVESFSRRVAIDPTITDDPEARAILEMWRDQAIAFRNWVDLCNLAALAIQDAVVSAQRAIPTEDELIAEMPPTPEAAGPVIRTIDGALL